MSQCHRTYAVDQIDDVGKSIPICIPASRSDYAEWLLDVFDRLAIQQAAIVGLSYGGFLALNFAMAVTERVKRLVLLCPGIPSLGAPTLRWAIHGMPIVIFPSRLTARWLVQRLSAKGHRTDDLHAEQLIVSGLHLRSRVPFRPSFDDSEFANLKIPVQLLIGEKESMYDAKSAMVRARQLIPNIEAEIIPNAGHMLSTDQPKVVTTRILQFLHSDRAI